jgi:hypothetical protein
MQFDARMQDQSLGGALIVSALEPAERLPLGRQKQSGLGVAHIQRQTFDTDVRVRPCGGRLEVIADTSLQVEL